MGHRMQTITDATLRAMDLDNRAQAKRLREAMGTRYLCHPDNRVKRCDARESNLLTVQRQLMFFGKNDGNEKEIPYPFKAGS